VRARLGPANWRLVILLLCAAPLHAVGASDPAAFPDRPIHLIVPSAPAGAGDALAREVATRLARTLNVGVLVDNRPGAGGVVGTELAARATPDGYTLLLATSATHLIAAIVSGTTRYDPVADFEPVINLAYATSVIVVSRDAPVRTLDELTRYSRARPGVLAYASSGAGSANHLDMEVLCALTGMSLLHVPYRGTADGYRALIAGDVQVMVGAITSALPHIQAGNVRPLAVMSQRRYPLLPDVPTMTEVGVGAADVQKWLGIVAPAGTPQPVIHRLHAALAEIVASPDMSEWLRANGFESAAGSRAEFATRIAGDLDKWRGIVQRVVPSRP